MMIYKYDPKQQERCCSFLDNRIITSYEDEMEQRLECADLLDDFLNEEEISFEDFYDYVHYYSLGYGLDYLREVNDTIPFLYPIRDFERDYDELDT